MFEFLNNNKIEVNSVVKNKWMAYVIQRIEVKLAEGEFTLEKLHDEAHGEVYVDGEELVMLMHLPNDTTIKEYVSSDNWSIVEEKEDGLSA